MAVSQVIILSSLLVADASIPALSPFDWIALYGLAAVLLMSMVLFFRLRKRAIQWFIAYVGLGSWVAWVYGIAPRREPQFDELVSLAGLLVALAVLAYMLKLKKQKVLV
jgi:uncharacterized membrane protein (DUF373 family)